MRILQADRIYPVTSPFIPEGMVLLDEDGTVLEVLDPAARPEEADRLKDTGKVERLSGWLVPGFINAHCHLELSWMKGRITRGSGLADFIRQLVRLESPDTDTVRQAMQDAEEEMRRNGIVGVGDISNTVESLEQKRHGVLRYHTFVETFDLRPEKAAQKYHEALALAGLYHSAGLSASVVPHSPYTVSKELMRMISEGAKENEQLLSIHHQETASEDTLFRSASGELSGFLAESGAVLPEPTGHSSFQTLSARLNGCSRVLLVHNTYTDAIDHQAAESAFGRYWWCMCPSANLFIEKRLPEIPLFFRPDGHTLIGTDSLASNTSLSVLEEMKTIAGAFPGIAFEELLAAATINAARFFSWEDELGSLAKGKRPGFNLLDRIDGLTRSGLTSETFVKAVR